MMKEAPEGRLNKKIISVWRLSGLLLTLLLGVCLFGCVIAPALLLKREILYFGIAGGITALLLILLVFILPGIRWVRWRYAVYEDEIDIYRGIIVRKRIVIPLIRVQYTDTSQGPLLRAFKLADVNVSTAGGEQSIPGLKLEDADALRDRVATLAKQVHENV